MKEKLKELEGKLTAVIVMFIIFSIAAIISCICFEHEPIRMIMTLSLSFFAVQVMCEEV